MVVALCVSYVVGYAFFYYVRRAIGISLAPPFMLAVPLAAFCALATWRGQIALLVVAFCLYYGVAFGLLGAGLPLIFAIPVAILGAMVVWALPEQRTAPTAALVVLLYAFLIALIMWPNYLGFALPGLPWITMARLTGFPLTFVLLLSVSVSSGFRTSLREVLDSTPAIWKLLVFFIVIQTISIGLSRKPLFSVDQYLVAQTSWTAVFFASAYVFMKPGRVERAAAILWLMALGVSVIAMVEWRHGQVPWATHIPSFLKIEDPVVQAILAGGARSATGIYRVQSTFSTSLGLAEYLALAMPFVLLFATGAYRWPTKLAAVVSIPFILYVILLSGSRLGMVGCLFTFLVYTLVWSVLRWRRRKDSLLGPAVTLAYPLLFCAAMALTFTSHTIKAAVWGNGPQDASNEGRKIQIQMGIPKILHAPWGHGIGMGGAALGYFTPSGRGTIDNYYLSIALEYGVIGFIVYFGVFVSAIYYAARWKILSNPAIREYNLLVPLAIAMANFIVIKSVFSEQGNHPLVFIMLGMIAALVWQIRSQTVQTALVEPESSRARLKQAADRNGKRRQPF